VFITLTTITTSHFFLRVVSAEFHTSRSEARQLRTLRKQALLDSYLYNLPSSAKKMFAKSQEMKGQTISNNRTMKNVVYWE